jgi:uncharacterized protein
MNNHSILIDNLVFSKNNEHLSGVLNLADFPRLAELLQSEAGYSTASVSEASSSSIAYTLQGKTDPAGQHYLHLKLNASLKTTCQRCMGEMPLNLVLDFNYLIGDAAVNDIEASEIEGSDDLDLQQASVAMDVKALIEDEIIMAMPIAPIHEKNCGTIITQSGEKANPFAALKGLIKP